MTKSIVEIEIIQPGRASGQYQPAENGNLQLTQVVYPDVILPFDIGILPNTLTPEGDPLKIFLLGETSHPMRTQVTARLLGGVQLDGTYPYLLAVSSVDERFTTITSYKDLSEYWRSAIDQQLSSNSHANFHWLNIEELEPWIKQARKNNRLARVKKMKVNYHNPPGSRLILKSTLQVIPKQSITPPRSTHSFNFPTIFNTT